MRRFTITIWVALLSTTIFAQNAPINFEPNGLGANWSWKVFENSTNPPLEIIDNPDPTGINTSSKVAQFTALKEGSPFAGCESMHGTDIGTFNLNSSNAIVKIMVWKSVISDVGIKFARPNGEALPEIKVSNTLTNQWEELTFDFSSRIGHPSTIGQDQIIIFSDFDLGNRTQDNVIFFDNITFSVTSSPIEAAPIPVHAASDVISIFSDTYTNVPGTDFNPNWGQATVVTQIAIQGNNTLKYSNLNYQGTQLNGTLDVSEMKYLHIDFWTGNSDALNVFTISPGPTETPYSLTVPTTGWSSVDIPLSVFTPVDLKSLVQFKFEGNGNIYLDNIYFHKSEGTSFGPKAPINFEPNGVGADWTWNVFENNSNPSLEIIDNPDPSGINTSSKVAKFTALKEGSPFAGCESKHGADIGTFTLDVNNAVVKIMVWKSVISDVGLKFVLPNGEALPERKVANTMINQWEELSFDFSSRIGHPSTIGQDQIVIFPDFNLGGRTMDQVIYFDNITFNKSGGGNPGVPMVAAPSPIHNPVDVISIFSDSYINLVGTDFNPNWGQATMVTQVEIQGNKNLRYGNLNYQGTQLGSLVDLSEMEYLHIDFWTNNSSDLKVFIISPGPVETPFSLKVPTSGWSSVDIPLSVFTPVDLKKLEQLKFEGNGDIYLDNIYFHKQPTSTNNTLLSKLKVYPNPALSGEIILLAEEINQFDVFSINGQIILSGQGNAIKTVSLQTGVYIVKATGINGKMYSERIIIR